MKTSLVFILLIASIMVMEMAPEAEAGVRGWSSVMDIPPEAEADALGWTSTSQMSYYELIKKSNYGGCNKNGCCNCSKQAGSGACAATDQVCINNSKYICLL